MNGPKNQEQFEAPSAAESAADWERLRERAKAAAGRTENAGGPETRTDCPCGGSGWTPGTPEDEPCREHADPHALLLHDALAALRETLNPLVLLGDFIGNEHPGKTGIPAFDRCAIIGRAKDTLARAEELGL